MTKKKKTYNPTVIGGTTLRNAAKRLRESGHANLATRLEKNLGKNEKRR
ncbi:MAG: hypothetical protein HRU18_25770 [Pseudoalteromonas sp.]|nr:hypothetical protein [Pseudoalteromonas sp.]NRA81621.1 hypothetical protein [Pseudoalteromonas sp.]